MKKTTTEWLQELEIRPKARPALYIGSRTTRPYVRVRDAVRTISPGSGQASDGSPIGPYRWYWEKDSINV